MEVKAIFLVLEDSFKIVWTIIHFSYFRNKEPHFFSKKNQLMIEDRDLKLSRVMEICLTFLKIYFYLAKG